MGPRAACLVSLVALLFAAAGAALTSTAVEPASLVAGEQGSVAVRLTSSVDIVVGSFVVVQFPDGFTIDTASAALAVDSAVYSTTLSLSSVTASTVTCAVDISDILNNIEFVFTVSAVTNPGEGATGVFVITIQDSSASTLDQDPQVASVAITSSQLTTASAAPDTLVAGATGTVTVTFTSTVGLPVGSVIALALPNEFGVAATTVLSVVSNLDTASTTSVDVAKNVILVVVGGSAVPAGTSVSFRVNGITNPGAMTTGNFALETLDSSGRVYQSAMAIVGAVITSSTLTAASVTLSTLEAGASVGLSFNLSLSLAIPPKGHLMIRFPPEYWFPTSPTLSEAGGVFSASGSSVSRNGQEVSYVLTDGVQPSSYIAEVGLLRNPGVTATGPFMVASTDSAGRIIETATLSGITTVPGELVGAKMVPSKPHPGIDSSVQLTFITPVALVDDTLIYVAFPDDDYSFAVAAPSVTVYSPSGASATISWDTPKTAFAILISSSTIVAEGTVIDMAIAALRMPPSARNTLTATIQTWNSQGLRLDGPSSLTIEEISAVTMLPTEWSTKFPYPAITSPVVLKFDTNGLIPAGGQIKITLPKSDMSATTDPAPQVAFFGPNVTKGTATWDQLTRALLVLVPTEIPAYSTGVQLAISSLDTPATVRTAGQVAWLSTLDTFGMMIDGPSSISLDTIFPGPILGSRLWSSVRPNPGVTTNHSVTFFTNGRLTVGSKLEFVLPESGWSVTPAAAVTFNKPALGEVGTLDWYPASRVMTVTLGGSTDISAYSQIAISLSGIITPPKETGVTSTTLVTRGGDGNLIDGPGIIFINAIARGALLGAKTLQSSTTTSASMASKLVLSAAVSGALPSGSEMILSFPSPGWRSASIAVTASFVRRELGISIDSCVWTPETSQLTISIQGNFGEATDFELEINGMANPYDVESAAAAPFLSVRTILSDGGIVDESFDISINAITASDLGLNATWTSEVATPGVSSTQTILMTTGGQLEPGSKICVSTPVADLWTVLSSTTAKFSASNVAEAALVIHWVSTTHTICLSFFTPVSQESEITVTITDTRSPPSERSGAVARFSVYSHLGGLVNVGGIQINAIARGAVSGQRQWQSALFSPGPVASLSTTATLTATTSGQIAPGGKIVLTLPIEWQLNAVTCAVNFIKPTVFGTASCLDNVVTVVLQDMVNEYTEVVMFIGNVINPVTVLPAGVASLQTFAVDGGVIDESLTVSTGAIESALLDIVNAGVGDTRVAVVGASKRFLFQGFSVQVGDEVKFVDGSTTTSDANCGAAATGISDVGGIEITSLGDGNDANLRFMQASAEGQPFALCYKFGSNPFKLYREFSFTVKEVVSMTVSAGDSGVAVANYAKTWTFHGRGLVVGDIVRWIDASAVQDAIAGGLSPDCLDTSTLANLVIPTGMTLGPNEDANSRGIDAFNNAIFAFSPENAGRSFYLCYRFGNEPFKIYTSMAVEIKHVQDVQASTWGSDSVTVVDSPKTFSFVGEGLAVNDRLYFIEVGSEGSCAASTTDPSIRLLHNINEQTQSILFITSTSDTLINFSQAAAGKRAMLCYQFASEPYQLYTELQLEVKMVTGYTGTRGAPGLAVADVPEPLTFQGFGLAQGDTVRWIHSAEEDCDTHVATMYEAQTLDPTDSVSVNETYSAAFNFSSMQDDYQPILCYRFGIEKFKLYPSLNVKIATLTAKTALVGSREVAVVGARKVFTLFGTHLATGDRVSWTRDPMDTRCVKTELLQKNPATRDNEYVSYTTLGNDVTVAFEAFSSGVRVFLCYGFGTEPYRVFFNLFLDVKSVTNMRTLRGANGVAVSGALKTFLFEGDGVATGDFAKFVPDTSVDCSLPGITLTNIQKEFDDAAEMAIYVYENIPGITAGGFQFGSDKMSAGLSRVLCYRFGTEDFFFYGNFRIDVKTIWGLRQFYTTASGQANVAVVDEFKLIMIVGVGVSAVDKVKWVDGDTAQADQDCDNLPAKGLYARTINVFANQTMWFPFEVGSQGKPWKLCYKFDAEPFRLYSSIMVSVKEITDLLDFGFQDLAIQGKVVVVNQSKTWKPVGSGIQEGDAVKFVPLSVTTSADCGADRANTAGGSDLMTVANYNSSLVFVGILTSYPPTVSDQYHLCYRFQDEPFTYVKGITVATYGVISIDRRTILATASTPLQITGFRLSNLDRLGWTTDKSANGCRRVFGITDVSEAKSVVVFDKGYDSLFLCYSFDRQPFTMFTSIAVEVVIAEIWVPETAAIVSGQTVDLKVSGTFGLTVSSDQVAWVPSDALSCSPDAMAQYSSTMPSSVTYTSKSTTSLARAGSSCISVTFVPPTSLTMTEALSTWKLCYKFGNVPDFIMFGDVLCEVLTIQRVDIIESKPTTTGTTITFVFSGIGQQDFDVVKWIDVSGSTNPNDADCDSMSAVGGSAATPVVSSTATFDFPQQTGAMTLCYKFKGQSSFRLFTNVPVKDMTKSDRFGVTGRGVGSSLVDSSSTQFVMNRDVATVSLTLNKDINDLPAGSAAETTFKNDFTAAISTALGIDPSRVEILELLAGSVIVRFRLLPYDNVADPLVNELVQDLQSQLQNPTSALLTQGAVITVSDAANALTSEIEPGSAAVVTPTNSAAFSIRGYQRAGLFTFTTTVISVTERVNRLFVRVLRQQGTSDVVTLPFRLDSTVKTAAYGIDFRIVAPSSIDLNALFLQFEIGEAEKAIEIQVIDDNMKEAHFEYFKIILGEPSAPSSALGVFSEVTVRIYDYDDGTVLQKSSFPAPTNRKVNLLEWSVVENGNSASGSAGQLRVDSNGIFAIDQIVGDAEYNQECDFASPTGACAFSCDIGANLPSSASLASSYRVLSLTDNRPSFVATVNPVAVFPTSALTISFWIRTTQKTRKACILSYVIPSTSPDEQPVHLAVCDPTNLQFALDALDIAPDNRGRRGSLATFVDVSDGAWHFIAINWNAEDGRVRVLDNGMTAFDGGPYRVGYTLGSNGYFVVGQLARACSSSNEAGSPPVTCLSSSDRSLVADLQHVDVWSRVLSRSELLKQLQWPFRLVTNGLVLGWNFDSLSAADPTIVRDLSTRGVQQKNDGFLSCSPTPLACTKGGELPSVSPGFPCGPVYRNLWHFSAPPGFVKALASSYGGRLQFRMLAPSHNGDSRPLRGQISIFDTSGNHVSLSLGGFPLPTSSAWTYYSAILREDFGWIEEPAGDSIATADFQRVLSTASALWIRGDLWGIGEVGQGQEVVYLNDIKLFSR